MKEFSEFEKRIIQIFVDLYNKDELSRANVLYKLYGEDVFFIDRVDDFFPLKYKKTSDLKTILNELVSIKFLYDYLLREGYITESSTSELSVSTTNFIKNITFDKYNKYGPIFPDSISWVNVSNQSNKIWLSQVLIDLVNNNFKTQEQIRFEKQLSDAETKHNEAMDKAQTQIYQNRSNTKVAFFAAIVSFIGLLVALILPFCIKTKLAEKDEIIKEIQAVKKEIPAVINTRITNDKLDADIVTSTKIKSDAKVVNQPLSTK